MTENFCSYCDEWHEFLNFGKNFSGDYTFVCSDKLSDALVQTMMPGDYGVLGDDVIEQTQ